MIYALDDEGGGKIFSDADTAAPALRIESNGSGAALAANSFSAGYPGILVESTASGYPLDVTAINGTYGSRFRSAVTGGAALIVGKSVTGSPTIAPIKILNPSCASAALMEFEGGFISCTSVILTSVAHTDYVIPVSINGAIRYIAAFQKEAVQGGAAFS